MCVCVYVCVLCVCVCVLIVPFRCHFDSSILTQTFVVGPMLGAFAVRTYEKRRLRKGLVDFIDRCAHAYVLDFEKGARRRARARRARERRRRRVLALAPKDPDWDSDATLQVAPEGSACESDATLQMGPPADME